MGRSTGSRENRFTEAARDIGVGGDVLSDTPRMRFVRH